MHAPDQAASGEWRLLAKQIAGAWACGSVLMGTVALLFLYTPPKVGPFQACPRPPGPFVCSVPSLYQLGPLPRLAVFSLVGALLVALAVVCWLTAAATWLCTDTRARLLWVVLTGLGGLAGWAFAAGVTFAAGFTPAAQTALAYTAGGLPFGLVAAMLLRPWRANVAAIGLSAGLVLAGVILVAGRSPAYQHNVFAVYAAYAKSFFGFGGNVILY
jgi:hypothetical protein